jgi:hypothetical protein
MDGGNDRLEERKEFLRDSGDGIPDWRRFGLGLRELNRLNRSDLDGLSSKDAHLDNYESVHVIKDLKVKGWALKITLIGNA